VVLCVNRLFRLRTASGGDVAAQAFPKHAVRLLGDQVQKADVRRLDVSNGSLHATFSIYCRDDRQLIAAMNQLKEGFPEASITFIDNNNPPVT